MLTDQQQLAVHSVDQNVLVSAGAGSGKTHVLVERYVEILRRSPETSLAHIVAVTFTRKAAAEMRSRLKARFLTLSKDDEEIRSGNRARWQGCLSEVDSARIGTIHSLCESIIRSYPADSGVDPEFESLDELDSSTLRDESVTVALREVIAEHEGQHQESGEVSWDYQLLLGYSIEKIKEMLDDVIKQSLQFDLALSNCPQPTAQEFAVHAERFFARIKKQELSKLAANRAFRQALNYAESNPHSDPANKLAGPRHDLIGLCGLVLAGDEHSWTALVDLAQYKVGGAGGNTEESKALRTNLASLPKIAAKIVEKVPAGLTPEDERACNLIAGFVALYSRARNIYQSKKQERTALDFNDQIRQARVALEKPDSQARAYFNEKLKALLVDEFQDTNDVQANLLSLLAGEQTRVFLIGDDKQSIYKFQGADVATFNRWKEMLTEGKAPLTGESMVTKLNRSFRSHPGVVAFVNALFFRLFNNDPRELPYVAAFEALEPARQLIAQGAALEPVPAGAGRTGIEGGSALSASVNDNENELPAVDVVLYNEDVGGPAPLPPYQLEAAHVAHWIKTKVASRDLIEQKSGGKRPIEYGDFAVLVTKNSHFANLEEVFSRSGIPYVTSGGKGFLNRQEVTDFENLLRFLDNPNDSHSLLAVLRSPFCPLTDDVIHRIATTGKTDSEKTNVPLWVLLTEAAAQPMGAGGGQFGLKKAVRLLRTVLDYASMLPLGELVHKIISLTRYDLVLMVADDGRQRSRNVWKIAHMAREREHLTCGEFAQALADMREFGVKEQEAPLDSSNAIKLMTVHSSKGLEFPAVALPCLGGKLLRNPSQLIFHHSYGVAFKSTRLKEEEPPAWYQLAAHIDRQMEIEDRKRLLYVAMTRARDCLGLFLKHEGKRDQSYRLWLLDELGIGGHEASIPGSGETITITIPSATAATAAVGQTPPEAAAYALHYWFGFPPLSLGATTLPPLPAETSDLRHMADEPLLSVFEAPINELALVRLTPSARNSQGESDFAVTSPRVTGTFFHALLENLPSTKQVDRDWVRDIANNQGFHFVHPLRLEAFVDEGMRLLEIYYGSPLRTLVVEAHRRYNEIPYLFESGDWIATKRPDLIVEAADGQWYLIDYKTDKFKQEHLTAQVRKHKDQLQQYVRDLKRLSGIELKPALYFAQYGSLEYLNDD